MFTYQQGKELSLLDLCGDLYDQKRILIKKQSVHERFNPRGVAFMKAVLAKLLENQFQSAIDQEHITGFKRIRIKDSTRFALPPDYATIYKGHGGATHNSASMISIQYEYDLHSGDTLDLRLTTGTRNDQLDAKENTHDINKDDLFIRDLGYATLRYMSQIAKEESYFLNRLHSQITAYHAEDPNKEVDFNACQKRLKKYKLSYLEYDVLIGRKAQLPSRLIIYPVDQSTYEKRLQKTSKQAKSCGHQVSDSYKVKAWLSVYVTNASQEKIPSSKIKSIYGLRWQIELTFKTWKSQAKIAKVKEMKIYRFECQLFAKLIWLLAHMKICTHLRMSINEQYPDKTLSQWKYYKHAHRINYLIRKIITEHEKLLILIQEVMKMAEHFFLLEPKKKKSHYQSLRNLN